MISSDDCLWFIDDALNGMIAIVSDLGDDLANAKPVLPGANSPFAVLTHCLGVMEYWAGAMIAGRDVVRDRDAEFAAAAASGCSSHEPAGRASNWLTTSPRSSRPGRRNVRRSTRPTPSFLSGEHRAARWCTSRRSSRSTGDRWRSPGTCCGHRGCNSCSSEEPRAFAVRHDAATTQQVDGPRSSRHADVDKVLKS